MKKKLIAFAVSAAMLAALTIMPASAEETEQLVYSEDFSDASALQQVELRVGTGKTGNWTAEDVSNTIDNGVFKMLKVAARDTATDDKFAEMYETQIQFGDNVIEETDHTKTYLKTYKGVYKIEAEAQLNSTTQLAAFAPSGIKADAAWKAPMPFVMETNGAFGYSIWRASNQYDAGYVGESAPFINEKADGNYKNTEGIVKNKAAKKIIFTVDTVKGTVKGDLEGYENGGVSHAFEGVAGGDDYQLTGIRIAMKPNHAPNEYITVDNIKVYQMSLAEKEQAAVDAAAKLTVSPVVYENMTLTDTVAGASVVWKSDSTAINAETGAVTQTDSAQAVTLTAAVTTADGATAYKDFYVTVAGTPQMGEAAKYSVTDDGVTGNAVGFGAEIQTGDTAQDFGFVLNEAGKDPWYIQIKSPQITGGTNVKYGLILEAEDSVDLSQVTAQSYSQDIAVQ